MVQQSIHTAPINTVDAKSKLNTITMSEELLHEVLCGFLHDRVLYPWDEAEKLVLEIKKEALAEPNEPMINRPITGDVVTNPDDTSYLTDIERKIVKAHIEAPESDFDEAHIYQE